MQPRVDGGVRPTEHACDLAVRQAAGKLERDEVAVARVESGERSAHLLAAEGELRLLVWARRPPALGLAFERRAALALTELVECRVACDPEDPGLRGPAAGREAAATAVGALEGDGRHVLGSGPVAQERGDVRVHAREGVPVEVLEALRRVEPGPQGVWPLRGQTPPAWFDCGVVHVFITLL